MNETIKSILTRRSIKSYLPDQIRGEELEMLLLAGKYAASSRNRQPWYFVAVQDKELMLKIESIIHEARPPQAPPAGTPPRPSLLQSAPMAIIVFGDASSPASIHDCTLAMGNMMLAATSMELGSNWYHAIVSVLPETDAGKELFAQWEVPEGYVPYASAVFGYPAAPPAQRSHRRPGTVKIIG